MDSQACVPLFSGQVCTAEEIRSRLQECQFAVAWMNDENGHVEHSLRNHGIDKVHVRSPFQAGLTTRHQSDRFIEAIGESGALGLQESGLKLSGELFETAQGYLACRGIHPGLPLVVIHPGSGSKLKCSRPEILASVSDRLHQAGIQRLLLEGPADGETVESVVGLMLTEPVVIRGEELATVAGILAQASVYVGHDSGVTHLASLLGVPTVALFGPTDPARWGPRGGHVTVLRGAACSCSSWANVERCHEKACLAISSETIFEACRKRVESDVNF